MKPINVGLLGIGTVGGGTFTVLKRNEEEITRRAGRPIRITAVADKNLELAKSVTGSGVRLTDGMAVMVAETPKGRLTQCASCGELDYRRTPLLGTAPPTLPGRS